MPGNVFVNLLYFREGEKKKKKIKEKICLSQFQKENLTQFKMAHTIQHKISNLREKRVRLLLMDANALAVGFAWPL